VVIRIRATRENTVPLQRTFIPPAVTGSISGECAAPDPGVGLMGELRVCDGRLPPDKGKREATSARLARTAGKLYRMRDEAKADVFDYIEGPGGALPLALHPFPKH
jgi:hypothetical protein